MYSLWRYTFINPFRVMFNQALKNRNHHVNHNSSKKKKTIEQAAYINLFCCLYDLYVRGMSSLHHRSMCVPGQYKYFCCSLY